MRAAILVVILSVVVLARGEEQRRERPIRETEKELDRGTGRVVDDATHEIERMQRGGERTFEQILEEQERRERIERNEKTKPERPSAVAAGPTTRIRATLGGEFQSEDLRGGERLSLMTEILALMDEHDRALETARRELANDVPKLKRRELQLGDELARKLAGILSGYEIRRAQGEEGNMSVAPTTRPATHP